MGFKSPQIANLPKFTVVAGEHRGTGGGAVLSHIYPANGQVTSELKLANAADVSVAVDAARAAFPAWRAMAGNRRRDIMFKMAELIEKNAEELTQLSVLENGTPVMLIGSAIADVAQRFRYFGGWADKIGGEVIHTWTGPGLDYAEHEPYGVIGVIVPWNGPLFATAMAISPALATGNCVVVKAPELAPYTVMRMAELAQEAGFPAGVFSMVVGGPDAGDAIVRHPGVDKIQFVGSGATARKVLTAASETLKPCGLELGGKSAVIVFADADLNTAAQLGLSGVMFVSGQGCCNGTRVLVERSIYDQYLETIRAIAAHIPIGDPLDASTVMGPIISDTSLQRINGMIDNAKNSGSRLLTGGERLGGDHAEGYYLPITVFADVDINAELAQTEVFGPVLAVTPFDTEEEAIALANATPFGLAAYVHTENVRRAHSVAAQLNVGQIHINGVGEAMQPNVPFGGWKQSGYGRLGGKAGLDEFLQIKNVWVNLSRT